MGAKSTTAEHLVLSETRDGTDVLEFCSPASLYLTGEQALAYLQAVLTPDYQIRLTQPFGQLLQSHVAAVIGEPDAPIDLIDLGPGLPFNTLPIINYLRDSSVDFRYVPVDISQAFLTMTTCCFENEPFETIPLHMLFEELADLLTGNPKFPESRQRLINIGLTFNNFELTQMCDILTSLLRTGDLILAAAELGGADATERQLSLYRTGEAETFNFLPLKRLGISREKLEYFVRAHGSRIEMGFGVVEGVALDGEQGISAGAEIVTSVSYRHREDDLRRELSLRFSSVQIHKGKGTFVHLVAMR